MVGNGWGPPLLSFAPLANLGQTFFDAQDRGIKRQEQEIRRQTLATLGQDFQKGDFGGAAQKLAALGELGGAAQVYGLGQKMKESAREDEWLRNNAGILGGSPAAPAAPSAPSAAPDSLIQNESGGNWQAQNNAVGAGGQRGHFGRLQFGQARLQEAAAAGAIPAGTTPQQFMASPEMQQRAEAWHWNDIDNHIKQTGLDRAIGQMINGVPVTVEGMRAVAHLGGKKGLSQFIATGGRYNPADENGTRLSDYFARHGGSGGGQTQVAVPIAPVQQAPLAVPGVQVAENEADVRRLEAQMAAQTAGPIQMAQAPAQPGSPAADIPAPGAAPVQGFAIPGGQVEASIASDPRVVNLQRALAGAPDRFKPAIQSRLNILVEELKAQRQQNAPTNTYRDYERARTDPAYREFLKEQKAGTTVNIDQKGEGEYAKTVGKGLGERMDAISKEGDSARQDMAVIGQLRQLGGQIKNLGAGAALQSRLAEWGIKVGPNVSEIEAFNALVDKLTPQQRVPGSGASSDLDVRMFKSALPNLIRTPGGNELILSTLEAVAQDKAARAVIADRALTGELKPQDAIKELRALPDPMAALKEARKTGFKSLPQLHQERRAPEPPRPPEAPTQFREGQRARGPNGEIIIFRNGQWGQ